MFYKKDINGDTDSDYDFSLIDFTSIASKKVGLNSRISVGYLIRIRDDGEINHRFIQQYAFTQKLNSFRLAHRFVSDQTTSKSEPIEFRLRYRIVAEIPLNGHSVDIKELYLKLGNEYLGSFQQENGANLETRLLPFLGYVINDNHKFEIGLDYRIGSLLNQPTRHSYWMNINWFIEI
ncbi:DUF2490 domain-containing protein [Algoriphagus sp. CAU 1675]|uniref:DUF2490 domain-containing protein n=1 Tax=Algoriphagus sp. CAU 1675 TaxID=3032597 RepID=UPI0031F33BF7